MEVFEGERAEGTPLAVVTTDAEAGTWTSAQVPLLAGDHTLTAIARAPSAIGNGTGVSATRTFIVDTKPPEVDLDEIASPTHETEPSFAGTSSEEGRPVTVEIYAGAQVGEEPIESLSGEVLGGKWETAKLASPLADGEYTAVASQTSALGNATGRSEPITFKVEAKAPAVVTESATPDSPGSSWLYGSVDPNGGVVSKCNFEYGLTSQYGKSSKCAFVTSGGTDCGFESPKAGCVFPNGDVPVVMYSHVFTLKPSTTYHFRLVATKEGVTVDGADQTFTTPAEPEVVEGPTGSIGVIGSRVTNTATIAALEAAIAKQLAPTGHKATIAQLLLNGGFKLTFSAPSKGTAKISWSYVPPMTKGAHKTARRSILIASGKHSFKALGKATIEIRLTAAGRRMLLGVSHLRVVATCVFAPPSGQSLTASKSFQLRP